MDLLSRPHFLMTERWGFVVMIRVVYPLKKVKITNLSHNRFGVSSEEKQEYLDNSYPTILNSH